MMEENIERMSLPQLVEHITKKYHIPLRKNLITLDILIAELISDYINEYPELTNLEVLFGQFKTEILKHITREDFITFPAILRFEKIYTDDLTSLSDDFDLMDKLVNDVQMNNQHTEFNLYLNSIVEFLEGSTMNIKHIDKYETIKSIFVNIQEENVIHTKIENRDLYAKGIQLQNKLKNKLENI